MDYSKGMYLGPNLDKVIHCLQFGDKWGAYRFMIEDFTSDWGDCNHDPDPDTFEICEIDGQMYVEFEESFVVKARKARELRGRDGDGI